MAQKKSTPKTNTPSKPLGASVRPSTMAKKSTNTSWFSLPKSQNSILLFDKTNYIILGIGIFLIALGFILMSGGNTDPKVFNVSEIYSFRRITLAPIVVMSGFVVVIIAILKKPATIIES